MLSVRSIAWTTIILLGFSMPAKAQDAPFPWWLLFGFGEGSAKIACGGCTGEWSLLGPTALASAGLMLTPQVGIGLGWDQWRRDPSDTAQINTATVVLRYHPKVHHDGFLEAGVGASGAAIQLPGDTVAAGMGWALMVGVGYNVQLTRGHEFNITLMPRVSYVYSPIGALRDDPGGHVFATGWRHQVLSAAIGLGVTGPRVPQ